MAGVEEEIKAPDLAVLRTGEPLEIVEQGGRAVAFTWPGMGAKHRAMHRIDLEPGGASVPMRHEGEAVYCVTSGTAVVEDLDGGERHVLPARRIVYVPHGVGYRIASEDGATIHGGPCPPDPALYGPQVASPSRGRGNGRVRVIDPDRDGAPVPMIGRNVKLAVWPGMGAEVATMVYAPLDAGEENVPHVHDASDDTIAVVEGAGSIEDLTNSVTYEFEAGEVLFVRAGIRHQVRADRGVGILSVGGPCPPDFKMLKAMGLVPAD
jgi:mannose-6-phosphate isomerase-like protein (cupin superfamily)